jgi:hypothetical protein
VILVSLLWLSGKNVALLPIAYPVNAYIVSKKNLKGRLLLCRCCHFFVIGFPVIVEIDLVYNEYEAIQSGHPLNEAHCFSRIDI